VGRVSKGGKEGDIGEVTNQMGEGRWLRVEKRVAEVRGQLSDKYSVSLMSY
jgi:hypothetical protein